MLGMGYGMAGNNANKTAVNNVIGANAVDLTTFNGALPAGGINLFGPVGSAIASRSAFDLSSSVPATTFDIFHPSQLTINNNCLTLATTTSAELLSDLTSGAAEIKKVDLEVPEEVVSGILGPAGRSLLELQYRSGALVQVSKKGLYASGMNNRVVTISGTPTAVATAQFLIEHLISEMDMKRLRNSIQAIE